MSLASFNIGPAKEPGALEPLGPGLRATKRSTENETEPGGSAQAAWESLAAFLMIFFVGLASAAIFLL